MAAVRTSKTSAYFNENTRRYIPEGHHLNTSTCFHFENFRKQTRIAENWNQTYNKEPLFQYIIPTFTWPRATEYPLMWNTQGHMVAPEWDRRICRDSDDVSTRCQFLFTVASSSLQERMSKTPLALRHIHTMKLQLCITGVTSKPPMVHYTVPKCTPYRFRPARCCRQSSPRP
jgi:hypothetical protein